MEALTPKIEEAMFEPGFFGAFKLLVHGEGQYVTGGFNDELFGYDFDFTRRHVWVDGIVAA